jgi:hypothetical protein
VIGQLLLPCIATAFTAAGNAWQVPAPIASALAPKPEQLWANRCYGFWATTTDPAAITPAAPAWPTFTPYGQPQPNGSPIPVPVRLWRYATGSPDAPFHQAGRITLDATETGGATDPELDGMIPLKLWSAPNTDPDQIGIDKGGSVLGFIECLQRKDRELTVRHLPEATVGGLPGPRMDAPLVARPSFVGRYYSQPGPGEKPRGKDLTAVEPSTSRDTPWSRSWTG